MARIAPILFQLFALYLLFSFALVLVQAEDDYDFVRAMDCDLLGLKRQTLSHFKLYWHNTVSGNNPSCIRVVKPPVNSTTEFGFVSMFDDPLTETPELSSKLIGKAQGFLASAAQEQLGILMAMNFHFVQGKYNGSTITVLGRNQIFDKVREMPVIGGSGLFRFATGYVEARTYTFSMSTKDAIVEYNCYVLHY